MATASQSPPVTTSRHRSLQTATWEKQGQRSKYYNVRFVRSYNKGTADEPDWQDTEATLGRDDLPLAAYLLRFAYGWIHANQNGNHEVGGKKPVHSRRDGNIEVAIWKKTGQNGDYFPVGLQRHYKDGETWKKTPTIYLGQGDLLAAELLLQRTFNDIDALAHGGESGNSFVETAKREFNATEADGGPNDDIPF